MEKYYVVFLINEKVLLSQATDSSFPTSPVLSDKQNCTIASSFEKVDL